MTAEELVDFIRESDSYFYKGSTSTIKFEFWFPAQFAAKFCDLVKSYTEVIENIVIVRGMVCLDGFENYLEHYDIDEEVILPFLHTI